MSNFNVNNPPPGLAAIPWLIKGVQTLWRRLNGTSGGGGGGISSVVTDDSLQGDGTVATPLSLVDRNILPGVYGTETKIPILTINGKGVITAANSSTSITDLALDDFAPPTGELSINNNRLTDVKDPSSAQDAATKNYVDSIAAGINPAVAVQVGTTTILPNTPVYNNGLAGVGATLTTLTLNTLLIVDGYTLVLGDRILVKNQTSGFQNGIYDVTQMPGIGLAWILTRSLDFNQPSDINNTGAIPIINGTVNATTQWVLSSRITTVGSDSLLFTQFSVAPSSLPQIAQVSLSSADILNLNLVPINLISAPGAGKVIKVLGIVWDYTFALGAYSSTVMQLNMGGVAHKYLTTLCLTSLSSTVIDVGLNVPSSGLATGVLNNSTLTVNGALTLTAAANPTGGSGTAKITIYYVIVNR